jgi:hypothetical protein
LIYHIQDNHIVELTSDYVEYIYSKYVPDGSLIVTDKQQLDTVVISDNISHIVFDAATNPVDPLKYLENVNVDRPFTLVSGLYHYHQRPDPRIKFLPFWAIWMSDPYTGILDRQYHRFSNSPKKYKFSCLNGTTKEHRKLLYVLLNQKHYFKDIVFTFGHRPLTTVFPNEILLTIEEQKIYQSLPQAVEFIDSDAIVGIDLTLNHPAYQESYVNLVTETTVVSPMLSEKTFKPIVAGQLFVLVAYQGAMQFLRDIGVDTFDDIIDHSYDLIEDTRTRINQALVQIDRLVQLDLPGIYKEIKPRLIKNSEYFLSNQFRDQFWLNSRLHIF